ncbi:hypothetical protein SAMD00019534_048950 [Acytostelium subglobosum LB1]|uniref:hypothetical protein n=1 Tax=Acytostelium subglobosum LB1 TaxID=1410327 RepID=UPI0006448CDA|nr:hypothetical protein SAMD00019534_048950 [Acytostelium subglobosum LB1]GAM21720.1 hypothetical protein SAMD00019534_048950 [Acytostelium subglobosum LB1]|eukprot:XP_012755839.1 hypothetical protein SAMD00019534_048950 [Acytostelium subglobosum LB1]
MPRRCNAPPGHTSTCPCQPSGSKKDTKPGPPLAFNTFKQYVEKHYKRAMVKTDMCPNCVEWEKLIDRPGYSEALAQHKLLHESRRESFRAAKRDLKAGEILLVWDFKENININQAQTMTSKKFYDAVTRSFFSIVMIYNVDGNIMRHTFSFLSNILDKTHKHAMICLEHMFKSKEFFECFVDQSKHSTYIPIKATLSRCGIEHLDFWSDNGPTFKCYELLQVMENKCLDLVTRMLKDYFSSEESNVESPSSLQIKHVIDRKTEEFKSRVESTNPNQSKRRYHQTLFVYPRADVDNSGVEMEQDGLDPNAFINRDSFNLDLQNEPDKTNNQTTWGGCNFFISEEYRFLFKIENGVVKPSFVPSHLLRQGTTSTDSETVVERKTVPKQPKALKPTKVGSR